MEIAMPMADGHHHAQADNWVDAAPPQALCSGADAVANADENGNGQAKELDASSKDPSSNDASRDATRRDSPRRDATRS